MVILGFIFGAIVAVLAEVIVFSPLRNKGVGPEGLMISSLGVGIFLRNFLAFYFTSVPLTGLKIPSDIDTISIDSVIIGGKQNFLIYMDYSYSLPVAGLILILVTVVLVGLLFALLKYTKLGKSLRATSDNQDLAESSGINTKKSIIVVWIIGGGLASVAGVIFSWYRPINPNTGFLFLLPTFAVIVLASIGSLKGTVLAAFIIAFSRQISISYLSGFETLLRTIIPGIRIGSWSGYSAIIPYVILILIIFFKPKGLFGGDD